MKIGCDVDGVLANFNEAFATRLHAVTGRDVLPKEDQFPVWHWPQQHGYTDAEVEQTWASVFADPRFWLLLPPYPTTENMLHRLSIRDAMGDDIYFITNRSGIKAKQQTEQWLRHCGYQGRPTVLLSGSKAALVDALSLDVYVDDFADNIASIWQHALSGFDRHRRCTTYLLTRPWNLAWRERYRSYTDVITDPAHALDRLPKSILSSPLAPQPTPQPVTQTV